MKSNIKHKKFKIRNSNLGAKRKIGKFVQLRVNFENKKIEYMLSKVLLIGDLILLKMLRIGIEHSVKALKIHVVAAVPVC